MVLERDLKKILENLGAIYARDCMGCLADLDTMRKQLMSLGNLYLDQNLVIQLVVINIWTILVVLSLTIQMGIRKLALISFPITHEDIMLEL